ncbi:hypothetical protein NIES4071_74130 [Calothrix sp. NIES-4071]|nr:hypothetical protein NIES4071_74130 [Calothrix sp. NIES-4071]BAZ61688.1 hypothetical protein NIES4105_74080 [Calothrix sp. NIES-4105]
MNLPSFIWLWKIAAWSMGLSLLAYFFLAVSGAWMFYTRTAQKPLLHGFSHVFTDKTGGMRLFHYVMGASMVALVLLLLAIGIVGTLGHFGTLGHSSHLVAGLIVVFLVLISAFSATQIGANRNWARPLHIGTNIILFIGFVWVSLTGWDVVQKYLP